jgi:hypothetical protein
MDPLQTVALQASWMTMVAHGLPVVPSLPAAITSTTSTTNSEYVASTTTNIADTVLKIAKEASELFKNVPYIKAFAGIVIQIINIREVRARTIWRTYPGNLTYRKFKRRRIDRKN